MTEYNRIARGSYTATTGSAQYVYLPFQPNIVKITNYTASAAFVQHGIPQAYWDVGMGQGFASVLLNSGATPTLITDVVTSNGISTFGAGLMLQYGARQQVVASTKGATTSFQVTGHGYSVGDVVVFEGLYQSATTGMPQICGMTFVITTVTDANNFVINWNSNNSSYTNLSGSPTGAYVKKVLYPDLYLPGENFVSAVSTGTTTTITTTTNHNYVTGQEIAFRIPAQWGTTQLNSLPNNVIPGSPIYGYVTSVTNNTTFVCSINSTGYTAFTTAVAVASVPGLSFPQVVAVGDVNTGGNQYNGGNLYPSPQFPTSSGGVSTINGPAIRGAFVNNTRQGFVIGAGSAVTDASSHLSGTTSDVVYWEAIYSDL